MKRLLIVSTFFLGLALAVVSGGYASSIDKQVDEVAFTIQDLDSVVPQVHEDGLELTFDLYFDADLQVIGYGTYPTPAFYPVGYEYTKNVDIRCRSPGDFTSNNTCNSV